MTKDINGKEYQSVLQDWVCDLPLRQQGTLLTAIRGCDLTPKFPLDSTERNLTAFVRYAVMNPFDSREIDKEAGCFMQSVIKVNFKPSAFGHYPLHYVMHLIHALQIIAYSHHNLDVKIMAYDAYSAFVDSFHLKQETIQEMTARLNEDRILKQSVVE